MSYLLPHLHSGYAVDQAIVSEEDRVVCIRFGHDHDPDCMLQVSPVDSIYLSIRVGFASGSLQQLSKAHRTNFLQDETLAGISDKIKNYAVIYLVDITEVPDFNTMVSNLTRHSFTC